MEDARENNQEAWIFSQDISKAYDSINKNMLIKALLRIKIPSTIINIITDTLTNRENKIITSYGTTDSYQVHDGIDQGDTISLLFWRIFYDPLLQEINDNHTGYTMKTEWWENLPTYISKLPLRKHKHQLRITSTAFVDDTTWYTNNKKNMQSILDKASEFFFINDIQANGEKFTLICINASKQDRQEGVKLSNIKVFPLKKDEAARILGVWITEDGKKGFQKNLIKEKVQTFTNILKWKKISDKQTRYTINHVLFPAIEYLLNDLVLSEPEYEKISSKINKVFKYKVNLSSTTPNCIIHTEFGYKLFNIWDRQILLHGNNWMTRINNQDSCSISSQIRLQQLQNEYWSHTSVIEDKLLFWRKKRNNLTNEILNILKVQGITFSLTEHMSIGKPIQGGKLAIKSITNEKWY
jgi:hypothetical protein